MTNESQTDRIFKKCYESDKILEDYFAGATVIVNGVEYKPDPNRVSPKTMRDELAMVALVGLLISGKAGGIPAFAEASYEIADAMIEARKVTK